MAIKAQDWGSEIASQQSSPLFGRIPAEIRAMIFEFAMSEETIDEAINNMSPDFGIRHDHENPSPVPHNDADSPALPSSPAVQEDSWKHRLRRRTKNALSGPRQAKKLRHTRQIMERLRKDASLGFDWYRPGYSGRTAAHMALLRTCRRVYLETHDLPAKTEHIFFHERGLAHRNSNMERYFGRMSSAAASSVRSIHLFTQMYWLEQRLVGLFPHSVESGGINFAQALANLERLRLTIRRGDWWYNESNHPLVIHPFIGQPGPNARSVMIHDMRFARKGGPMREGHPGGWHSAFRRLPKLKELVIDLETTDEQRAELDDIAEWARTWRFELSPGKQLASSSDGTPTERVVPRWLVVENDESVRKWSWQGLPYHFAETCPNCATRFSDDGCDYCLKRLKLLSEGKGPRLVVYTLTWKALSAESEGGRNDNGEGRV